MIYAILPDRRTQLNKLEIPSKIIVFFSTLLCIDQRYVDLSKLVKSCQRLTLKLMRHLAVGAELKFC